MVVASVIAVDHPSKPNTGLLGPPAGDQLCKCTLASDVLRRFGEVRLQVTGSSMLPSLCPGDLLVIRSACLRDLLRGDLVLFYRRGRFFVHRVQAIAGTQILTRGDALPAPDPAVDSSELLGRVFSISRDGVVRPPAPLGAGGRLVAWLACHSTVFCNMLLRVCHLRHCIVSPTSASKGTTSPFERRGRWCAPEEVCLS